MKKLLIIITLSLLALDAFAQRRVSGIVVDNESGEPLIGVTILEKGTRWNGTITDFDGNFSFTTTKDTCEIIISFVGFFSEVLKITSDTIIAIALNLDSKLICCRNWRFIERTIGVNYDFANSLFGISYNNTIYRVFDNVTSRRSWFEISVQSNFKNDFGFDGSIGIWNARRHFDTVSLHYSHKNFSENIDLNFNSISLKGTTFLSSLNSRLFVEPAFQSLNDKNNFGLTMGLQRIFWIWISNVNVEVYQPDILVIIGRILLAHKDFQIETD